MSVTSEKQSIPFDDSGEPIAHELPRYNPEDHRDIDFSIQAVYARDFHRQASERAAAALLRLDQQDQTQPTSKQ